MLKLDESTNGSDLANVFGFPLSFDVTAAIPTLMASGPLTIRHKAVLEVNAEGIRGAAATGGVGSQSAPFADFMVDRPFYMAVVHPATMTILFLARVVDPTS